MGQDGPGARCLVGRWALRLAVPFTYPAEINCTAGNKDGASKIFFIEKTFRAQSTNYLHQEKVLAIMAVNWVVSCSPAAPATGGPVRSTPA